MYVYYIVELVSGDCLPNNRWNLQNVRMYNTYVLVSVVSVETRILCMFLHCTVALVSGDL
jgi:hypothetical protein